MAGGRFLSIDIGSTWTKGALVDLDGPAPGVLDRAAVPTTQRDLAEGFALVRAALERGPDGTPRARGATIRFSSSAKGGLAIAAVGLVPDLTVNVARLAAASAGGKVTASFAYRLSSDHVTAIEASRPDIVLLCGGTDGGNEGVVLHNARALAASALDAAYLYAGNASIRDEVRRILAAKDLVVTDNLMPEVGRLELEPARERIRALFLDRIVEGRGLARVRTETGCDPKPTPLAVFELVEALAREVPGWDDVCVLDLGGATTDVYSSTGSFAGGEGRVLRGIRPPRLTRTVEGDLGMRVSARSAAESGPAAIAAALGIVDAGGAPPGSGTRESPAAVDARRAAFDAWVARVAADPGLLPATHEERSFDDALAHACLSLSLARHAGTEEEAWTPRGKVLVQRGKDLRAVRRVVGSGGFLARLDRPDLVLRAFAGASRPHAGDGARPLLPAAPAVYADRGHLVPLAANLAADRPREAARLVTDHLAPLDGGTPGGTP